VGEDANGFDIEKTADEIRQVLTLSPRKTEDIFHTYVAGVRKYGPKDLISDTLKNLMEGLALSLNRLNRDYIRNHDALLEDVFLCIGRRGSLFLQSRRTFCPFC